MQRITRRWRYFPVQAHVIAPQLNVELACLYQQDGCHRRAEHYLSLAAITVDPRETSNVARILWRRGDVAMVLNQPENAEHWFRQALKMLQPHPFDQVLINLDLKKPGRIEAGTPLLSQTSAEPRCSLSSHSTAALDRRRHSFPIDDPERQNIHAERV